MILRVRLGGTGWTLVLTLKSTPERCNLAQSSGECPGSSTTFFRLLEEEVAGFRWFGRVSPLPAATPEAPSPTAASLD